MNTVPFDSPVCEAASGACRSGVGERHAIPPYIAGEPVFAGDPTPRRSCGNLRPRSASTDDPFCMGGPYARESGDGPTRVSARSRRSRAVNKWFADGPSDFAGSFVVLLTPSRTSDLIRSARRRTANDAVLHPCGRIGQKHTTRSNATLLYASVTVHAAEETEVSNGGIHFCSASSPMPQAAAAAWFSHGE